MALLDVLRTTLLKQMACSRWWTFLSCIVLEIVGGSIYTFSLYSSALKSKLEYSQDEIQTVAFIQNIGGFFALHAGFIVDKTGPRQSALLGLASALVGFLLLYASATKMFVTNMPAVAIFAFISASALPFIDTAVVVTTSKNFAKQRPVALGIVKSIVGLSASILSQFLTAFFQSFATPSISFLLFLAFALPAMGLIAIIFLHAVDSAPDPKDSYEGWTNRRLEVLEVSVVTLAVYLLCMSFVQRLVVLSIAVKMAIAIVMIAIILFNFSVPYLWRGKHLEKTAQDIESAHHDELHPEAKEHHVEIQAVVKDFSLKEAIKDARFLLIIAIMTCLSGTGLMVSNNLGQVIQSYLGRTEVAGPFVSAFSVSSALGRIFIGAVSKATEKSIPLPWFYVGIASVMVLSQMIFANFYTSGSLFASCVLTGFSYGGSWVVLPTIVSKFFGTKCMGQLLAIVQFAPILGSLLVSRMLSSSVYSSHVKEGETVCDGVECFQDTFFSSSGICAAAAVLSLILVMVCRINDKTVLREAKEEQLRRERGEHLEIGATEIEMTHAPSVKHNQIAPSPSPTPSSSGDSSSDTHVEIVPSLPAAPAGPPAKKEKREHKHHHRRHHESAGSETEETSPHSRTEFVPTGVVSSHEVNFEIREAVKPPQKD